MKTIDIAKASKSLAEYAEELSGDVIIVTSRRKPVAALVSLKDFDEESTLHTNPRFLAILEKSRQQIRDGEVLTHAQIKKKFRTKKTAKTAKQRTPRSY